MEIIRANKYKLLPTAKQKAMLHEMFGMSRFAFNHTLGKLQDSYFGTYTIPKGKNKGDVVPKIPSQMEMIGFSTELKQNNEFMNRLPNDYIQASLANLYSGVKGFYRGGGYPKFKSRKHSKHSINMKAGSRVKIEDNKIQIIKLKGTPYEGDDLKIKFKKHKTNHEIGKITGFTISKDNLGEYWISITSKIEIKTKTKTGKKCGIDLGIKDFVICDDGTKFKNKKFFKQSQDKLAKEQRKLSKKKIGSRNRNKQRIKVAKVHKKIRNQRNNYNHEVSAQLVNIYDFIGLESLQVQQMMQNRGLSKSIQDVSWFDFITKLKYKMAEKQGLVVQIDKWFPSTKTCSSCGNVKKEIGLDERTYTCHECGFVLDRDVNAAKNILAASMKLARME